MRRVFLHVGLPKSGTTYVQAVAVRHKAQLMRRASLLFPGESWVDQVDAVRDLRELAVARGRRAAAAGAWDRLVAEMTAWPGDALISMEWLCKATSAHIDRIGADLAGSELNVMFTVRDLSRTVPAAWQESTQNRATWRWPEYLEQVSSDQALNTKAGSVFWEGQDMERLLERWSALAPPERIHVVTVPRPGAAPEELWRRTAAVLGVDADGYDLADLSANTSLGRESAELMRRVNEQVPPRVGRIRYEQAFKYDLAKRRLAARHGRESAVELPSKFHGWVVDVAEQQVRAIEASGVRVHGSLDDLRPRAEELAAVPDDADADPDGVLDAAVEALVAMALERRVLQDEKEALDARVRAQRSRLQRQSAELARRRAESELRARRPLRQALVDASVRHPLLHRARVGYRRVVNASRRLRHG